MKAIQITLDEALLARLDADDEVRRDGRSAVLRRAAEEYLRKRRRRAIATQYVRAYSAGQALGAEFSGWEDEGEWPER
jgi:metal-responsive CopG/Arc/MetJ family transcriptional regulator